MRCSRQRGCFINSTVKFFQHHKVPIVDTAMRIKPPISSSPYNGFFSFENLVKITVRKMKAHIATLTQPL